ncbi:putative T6SS immunity periplasmic lipoprotein [Enterobacteriaceae bacterium LUAb1]
MATMIIRHLLPVIALLSLSGCWMGDYVPPIENTTVKRSHSGLCFNVKKLDDYKLKALRIRNRDAEKGFFRNMPALTITEGQLCVPDSYYHFPEEGDFVVEYSLHSPGRVNRPRFMVAVFRLTGGEPFLLPPRESEVPATDLPVEP